MVLCLGIIEDNIAHRVIIKNFDSQDNPYVLERFEIFRRSHIFNAGVLYGAHARELPPDFTVQDGAALICIGVPPAVYLASELRIIVLDDAVDIMDLSNDVNRIFFEYNTLEQKLQECVNKGRSIQYLVEIIAPYFNSNEVIVCNSDYRIIGQSNKTLHMDEISGIKQPDSNGYISPENVEYFKNDATFNELWACREPFYYEPSIFACRSIGMNIFYRGEYACRIVLTDDVNGFRGYELGFVRFFGSFVQLVYDLAVDCDEILPKDHLAELFSDLLNGDMVEAWRLENSMSHRSWRATDQFFCLWIKPSEGDIYTRTIPYYCQIYNRDFKGCCFFEYEASIVCVTNLRYYGDSSEHFFAKYRASFRDGYFRVGYSNAFGDISNLVHYFTQARIALNVGLKHNPTIWFHKFANNVLWYIEDKLTEELDGQYLCAPEPMILLEYDKKNQTELLKTLKEYINNDLNVIKTAEKLFIHRSTMNYRLERIRELTGLNFKTNTNLLYLTISVNLLLKDQ